MRRSRNRLSLQILALLPIPLILGLVAWRGLSTKPPRGIRLPKVKAAALGKGNDGQRKALPATLAGWKRGAIETFDKKTLFDRIDGAAPPYIAAGFRHLRAFDVTRPGGKENVQVEIYRLGDNKQARALHQKERGPLADGRVVVQVGDEGHKSQGALAFVVASFYVKLAAFEAPDQAQLEPVAQALAAALGGGATNATVAKPLGATHPTAKAPSAKPPVGGLPDKLAGWPRSKIETFDKKTLFDRIDGAAPPYIAAGFVALQAFDVTQPGGKETVQVEVYALGDNTQARALHQKERGPLGQGRESVKVGDEGHKSQGALAFVVGAFYVKLAAFEPAGQKQLEAVAQELAAALRKAGKTP